MQIFRLYQLGPSGQVLAASHIFADDDVEALRLARSRALSLESELWAGRRFIARLPAVAATTIAGVTDRAPPDRVQAADGIAPAAA